MLVEYIEEKVRKLVCFIVGISDEEIYTGNGNIPFKRAVARNLCLYILHDRYAVCYRQLALMTSLTQRSVMRCVKKARMYIEYDKAYIVYLNRIRERL